MTELSSRRTIIRNLISNYAMSIIGMTLGFFLVPFLVKKLGKELYGVVILAESVVMFSEVISVSIRVALSRYVTFALSSGNQEDFAKYLFTGRRLLHIAAFVVVVLGCALSWYFPQIFHMPAVDKNASRLLFLMVVLGVVAAVWSTAYWSGLYAAQRNDLINVSSSLGLVLRAVCIFLLFSVLPAHWVGLSLYGLIYMVMSLFQACLIQYFFRRAFPQVRFLARHWDPSKVREILSFSAHTTISRVSGLLYTEFSNIIINLYWGASANTIFAVGGKIPGMFSKIFVEPGWALTSTFTEYVARGAQKKLEDLLFLYSKTMCVITFPLVALVFFGADALLLLWVGPGFEASSLILRMYTAHLVLAIPLSMTGSLFNAYGRVRIPSYIGMAAAILNVLLIFVFGVWLNGGLPGVVLASIVSALGVAKTFYTYYACRISRISARRYTWQIIFRPILVNGLVAVLFWFLKFSTLDLYRMTSAHVIAGLLMLATSWVASWFFVFSSWERGSLSGIVLRRLESVRSWGRAAEK